MNREYNIYILDKYIITYNSNILFETYSSKDYCGIIFFMEDGKYDLIHNFLMGTRLLVNHTEGGYRDIPLNPSSFNLLPEGITIEVIG